ncbi:alpha/beta hydrolase [Knoellia sinensis KCTC 19936]|uniref:Alpha/beta hydrolase n=1 Tax=Knoellia sinensis KCTC 19936 TaxID=1385520 RepID=A0A0A0JA32_9MICO|nr:alpha/beta fold hydrolase [Knoellia sinensis]KGN33639.1 alpha/beta hydrolase [Knoellia sinensis KCTC 19936]
MFNSAPKVGHFRSDADRDRYLAAYDRAMAELPEPSEVLDVPTSHGTVRVYRFDGQGKGAPIVALPGTRSGVPVLAANLPGLLEHRTVYALDLLGEPGRSVQTAPITTHEEQADWLAATLVQLPEGAFHLVGLSIGGWTAVNLAVHRPDRLATISLIDSPFVVSSLRPAAILRSIPVAFPSAPRSWRDSFNSWTAGGAPVEDVPVADMIEAGMQTYAMALPTPSRTPEDKVEALDIPTMMIVAGASPLHDAREAAQNARRLLDVVHVYEGASHAVNGEQPERLARDVGAFIDAHEPAVPDPASPQPPA